VLALLWAELETGYCTMHFSTVKCYRGSMHFILRFMRSYVGIGDVVAFVAPKPSRHTGQK